MTPAACAVASSPASSRRTAPRLRGPAEVSQHRRRHHRSYRRCQRCVPHPWATRTPDSCLKQVRWGGILLGHIRNGTPAVRAGWGRDGGRGRHCLGFHRRSFAFAAGELASLRQDEYRPKIESWERRSSEPAYLTPNSPPDLDRSSPPAVRPLSSLHPAPLENGHGPRSLAVDKSGGIQRRRSLRRGGSVRVCPTDLSEARLFSASFASARVLGQVALHLRR